MFYGVGIPVVEILDRAWRFCDNYTAFVPVWVVFFWGGGFIYETLIALDGLTLPEALQQDVLIWPSECLVHALVLDKKKSKTDAQS